MINHFQFLILNTIQKGSLELDEFSCRHIRSGVMVHWSVRFHLKEQEREKERRICQIVSLNLVSDST